MKRLSLDYIQLFWPLHYFDRVSTSVHGDSIASKMCLYTGIWSGSLLMKTEVVIIYILLLDVHLMLHPHPPSLPWSVPIFYVFSWKAKIGNKTHTYLFFHQLCLSLWGRIFHMAIWHLHSLMQRTVMTLDS